MRGRFKKWAAPYLADHPEVAFASISSSDPFFTGAPLALEIGIGKGDFLLRYSELEPSYHYLGLERDVSILGMAAKKFVEAGRTNIRVCGEDFDDLFESLSPLRFQVIFLNFSDPWPKKRHEKRRLTYLPRLTKIASLLSLGGELRIKTDNDILYAFTQQQIQGLKGMELIQDEADYVLDELHDAMSEYERNFRNLNHPIHRIVLKKTEE